MNGYDMARAFARLPLLRQFTGLMVAVLLLGCVGIWLVGAASAHARALERARLIALMADAAGVWSSQYRGVWVLNDPTDAGVAVGESLDHRQARTQEPSAEESGKADTSRAVNIAHTAATFHRKVPSTVQRELADVMGRLSAGERVRITNEAPLDARHAPNRFEQSAIVRLQRNDRTRDEHFETGDGHLFYARRLAARDDCLRCHAPAAERAPSAMKAKFGSASGWRDVRDGGFGGIVSVSVPLAEPGDADMLAGVAGMLWVFLSAWATGFGVLLWWLQRQVVHAAAAMEAYAQCLLASKADVRASRVIVGTDEMASRNELHRLSLSLKAVHRVLRAAYVQPP